MGKIGPKFSHLVTVRAEGGADPPLTVSLTVKRPFFFWTTPLIESLGSVLFLGLCTFPNFENRFLKMY